MRLASASRLAVALVALASASTPVASAGPAPRERYWLDGDAKALAEALVDASDPIDREDLALARLAADPRAAYAGPADAAPLSRAADALRRADLEAAATACLGANDERDALRRSLVAALLDARQGRDDVALRRLVDGPAPVLGRDGAEIALLGAALPPDDRELLGGLARSALLRAGASGRTQVVVALAEAAVALDREAGCAALVFGARILRRMGRPAEALALLDGAAAERCGRARAPLRLERAILAWRRNDAATARLETREVDPLDVPWAFQALSKAAACCAVVPAPPLVPRDAADDADALARLLMTIGVAVRPEDVATRAAARSTTPADPAFVRAYLDALGVARLEIAGDPSVVEAALAKGLPVLLWRPRRDDDRFSDRAVLVRGHDATTGLLLADEPDPRRIDLLPTGATRKARALVVAPKARASELDEWRDRPGARRGARLCDALSLLFGPQPEAAATALAAAQGEGDATLDFYAGYASYVPAFAGRDVAGLARASALLRRSSATPPVTTLERLMRAEGALGADAEPALAELAEAARDEGPAGWIEITRFIVLESARRHADALAALTRARAIDPLDVRTLYFRSGTRRLLGDGPGGKADLIRVLDRRPDHLPAAEDLASLYVEEGAFDRALDVVKRLVAADPAVGAARRVHQLRQRIETRLVRKARSVADLSALASSPEADVRAEVAWTASSFDGDAAEALVRTFLTDPDESVRRRAALAYQRPSLTDRVARVEPLLVTLLARLVDEPTPGVREAIARTLSRVDSPRARAALVGRLCGGAVDPSVGVRVAIVDLLSSTDTADVRAALVGALADPDVAVRAPAIGALRRMTGTNEGFEPDDPIEPRGAAIERWKRRLASGR